MGIKIISQSSSSSFGNLLGVADLLGHSGEELLLHESSRVSLQALLESVIELDVGSVIQIGVQIEFQGGDNIGLLQRVENRVLDILFVDHETHVLQRLR